VLLVSEN